jgi:copper resistance protein C
MHRSWRAAPRPLADRVSTVVAGAGRHTVVALLAAAALVLVGAPAASAHDSLVSSSPSDGQTVATVPDRIVLTMNEAPVSVGTRVVVRGPDGEVQQGSPRVVKNTVQQTVAAGSPAGRYTVVWRVTSGDGHPVSGTFTFTADAAGTVASGSATTTPNAQGSTTTVPGAQATPTTAADQPGTPVAGPTSSTSTGESGQSGTFWALWLVVALVVMAGVGATVVRRRRLDSGRGHG